MHESAEGKSSGKSSPNKAVGQRPLCCRAVLQGRYFEFRDSLNYAKQSTDQNLTNVQSKDCKKVGIGTFEFGIEVSTKGAVMYVLKSDLTHEKFGSLQDVIVIVLRSPANFLCDDRICFSCAIALWAACVFSAAVAG